MKTIGCFLFVFGIIIGWFGLVMDTTVETGGQTIGSGEYSVTVPKMTVQNIGLLQKRQTIFYGAGVSLLLGAIFIGFGTLAATGPQGTSTVSPQQLSQLQKFRSGALISPEEVESLLTLARQQPLSAPEASSSSGNSLFHLTSSYFYALKVGILIYVRPTRNKVNHAKVDE